MSLTSTFTIVILLIILFSTLILGTYFLIENKKRNQQNATNPKKDIQIINSENSLTLNLDNYLEPIEIKFLHAIMLPINRDGLRVDQINELFNLSELNESNQRQRRHHFIKNLNLKLYMITGSKESIIRTSNRADKRIKYYTLELKNVDKIKNLANILLNTNSSSQA